MKKITVNELRNLIIKTINEGGQPGSGRVLSKFRTAMEKYVAKPIKWVQGRLAEDPLDDLVEMFTDTVLDNVLDQLDPDGEMYDKNDFVDAAQEIAEEIISAAKSKTNVQETKKGFPPRRYGKMIEPGDWCHSKKFGGLVKVADVVGTTATVNAPESGVVDETVPLSDLILDKSSYASKAGAEYKKRFGVDSLDASREVFVGGGSHDKATLYALRRGKPRRY